jgi:flavin reductase (DIM6/NTAB) family NADH-FMN oxidoreductase RutF
MAITGDLFKKLGRSAAGPVCIVAAFDSSTDVIVGLTASSFVTLSFDPPMVMFALQQNADSYSSIVKSTAFAVSILDRTQSHIATRFACKGRQKIDETKFAHGNTLHCPLILGALGHVECSTNQVLMSGDHAIVTGVVEHADIRSGEPLLYFGARYGTFTDLIAAETCSVHPK